jgi:hypothetical protein
MQDMAASSLQAARDPGGSTPQCLGKRIGPAPLAYWRFKTEADGRLRWDYRLTNIGQAFMGVPNVSDVMPCARVNNVFINPPYQRHPKPGEVSPVTYNSTPVC